MAIYKSEMLEFGPHRWCFSNLSWATVPRVPLRFTAGLTSDRAFGPFLQPIFFRDSNLFAFLRAFASLRQKN